MPDETASIAQVLIGIGEIRTQTAVINTKLDGALTKADDHEGRIRTLERFRFTLIGAGGVAGGLVGFLVNYLANLHH
jgi:hypothetical protein